MNEPTNPETNLLGGRYERLGVLGRGGQGVVERAWDRLQGRAVALKVRTLEEGVDRDAVLDEARLLLSVPPHPNIALMRSDFFEGNHHVLVMDFVDGPSLATRLAEEDGRGLPPADVVRWLSDVASALDHLHERRPPVMHGDVKPANIVIAGDRAVLVDFGLAAAQGGGPRAAATPGYAAPEFASGDPSPASDVYSLAATAYALLTGHAPGPGAVDALPAAARGVLATGLAVNPGARTPTAREFVQRFAAALGVTPKVVSTSEVRPRQRRAVALLVPALVLAVVGLVVIQSPRDEPDTPASRATTERTAPVIPAGEPPNRAVVATSAVRAPDATAVARKPPTVPAHGAPTATELGRVALYRGDGSLAVERVLDSGELVSQGSAPTDPGAWSTIAAVRPGLLFAYRRSDGHNRLLRVGADGTLTVGRVNPDAGSGWSHLVGLDEGLLFYYRQSDGYASTQRYSEQDRLIDGDGYAASPGMAGFDHVVQAGTNLVLLYASTTGRAQLISIGSSGQINLRSVELPAGWSVLAPTGRGFVLGIAPGGDTTVLRATATSVETVLRTNVGDGAWSAAVAVVDGAALHDRNSGRGRIVRLNSSGAVAVLTPFTTPVEVGIVRID